MGCVFIDTNIYLRFFDSNQKEFKKLLEELEKIKENIFVTQQFVNEINRNKLDVFAKSITTYSNDSQIKKVLIPEHFIQEHHTVSISDWNAKREELIIINSKLISDLKTVFEENLNEISKSSDAVSNKLRSILENVQKPEEREMI